MPFALAAVQRRRKRLRGQLRAAWAAVHIWKHAEPGELRVPVPLTLLWAMMSLALNFGDVSMAALLGLVFHCLLRPGEACRLRRSEVWLPGDDGRPASCGTLAIQNPKTARTSVWSSQTRWRC